jgi:hypothetical protein
MELVVRRLRHRSGDGQILGHIPRGRQPVAGLESPVPDRGPELLGQLQVQRQPGGAIEDQRQRSLHEWTT